MRKISLIPYFSQAMHNLALAVLLRSGMEVSMEEKLVLLCDGTIDGILTAVYEGFVIKNQRFGRESREYRDNIDICVSCNYNSYMFAEYIDIPKDYDKSFKTAAAIRKKIGEEAYNMVIKALCHYDEERASLVFGFLVRGFKLGKGVVNMLGDKYVMKVMELSRKAGNEAYRFIEHVRFKDMGEALYSVIEPKCRVIPLIGAHFDERYPNENWIIYDKTNREAALHKCFQPWIIVSGDAFDHSSTFYDNILGRNSRNLQCYEEDNYEELWKTFLDSLYIKERKNERCQNNLLPKWYRKNMTEFM